MCIILTTSKVARNQKGNKMTTITTKFGIVKLFDDGSFIIETKSGVFADSQLTEESRNEIIALTINSENKNLVDNAKAYAMRRASGYRNQIKYASRSKFLVSFEERLNYIGIVGFRGVSEYAALLMNRISFTQ